MLSRSKIKEIRALSQKKYRQKYHKIVVEGVKSISDILNENLLEIEMLCATPQWIAEFEHLPGLAEVQVEEVTEGDIEAISSLKTPQSVLAVCRMPKYEIPLSRPRTELCLYLDGIRDPGNVGTIFRIADWFGVRSLFLAPDTADPYNPKTIQASMASIFRIEWIEAPITALFDNQDFPIYATSLHGQSIYDQPLSPNGLIVLGNESTGVRLPDPEKCLRISIPRHPRGGAESLNVSVAAGIICAEFQRRSGHS